MVRPLDFNDRGVLMILNLNHLPSIAPEVQDEEELFEVAHVIADKVERGVKFFRVRWKNYGP